MSPYAFSAATTARPEPDFEPPQPARSAQAPSQAIMVLIPISRYTNDDAAKRANRALGATCEQGCPRYAAPPRGARRARARARRRHSPGALASPPRARLADRARDRLPNAGAI